MKQAPLLCLLLLPALSLAAASAEKPDHMDAATIPLPASALSKPIGVEPQGGRFQKVLAQPEKVGAAASTVLSTVSRRQGHSTLALFASDSDSTRDETPLARFDVLGLQDGEQKDRVGLRLTRLAGNRLSIEAWDDKTKGKPPLQVRPLAREKLRLARYAPTKDAPAEPVASSNGHPSGLAETLGVRTAGGVLRPLLWAGTPPNSPVKNLYLRPRFNDQTTVDLVLYAGDSPYVENSKSTQRFLISGLPPGDAKRQIKVALKVGSDGKLALPTAVEVHHEQQPLHVEKYTSAAVEKLAEPRRQLPETATRHLPAAPAVVGG